MKSMPLLAVTCLAMMGFSQRPATPVGSPPPLQELPQRPIELPVMACGELANRDFSTLADAPLQVISAKEDAGVPVCHFEGLIAPQVRFRLDLPTTGYRGRYLEAGCGGNCGQISTRLEPRCANSHVTDGGFAVAASDSGHSGRGETWAADAQMRIDYAYRADHVTLIAARALLTAFYGRPPDFAYFAGCSDGGREGLEEAQRYPGDFQGILAGSPSIRLAEVVEEFFWAAEKNSDAAGNSLFDSANASLLHQAVLKACDDLDGVADGQIDDPRRCAFDPGTLLCPAGTTSMCLSPAQVQAARDLYSGPVDSQGRKLHWGGQPHGSELTWSGRPSGQFPSTFVTWMIYGGHPPASMDVNHWHFTRETLENLAHDGAIYDARNPDLAGFRDHGGKLIMWQNFADVAAGENSTLAYYQSVRDAMGGLEQVRRFARVFMIPAGYHCSGGYIAYDEDLLGSLINWVEKATPADKVISRATLPDGVERTRPIYAYPTRAVYTGSGDVNDVQNFRAEVPGKDPDDHFHWLGEGIR